MCVCVLGSCIVQGIESETLSPVKVYSCQYGPRRKLGQRIFKGKKMEEKIERRQKEIIIDGGKKVLTWEKKTFMGR